LVEVETGHGKHFALKIKSQIDEGQIIFDTTDMDLAVGEYLTVFSAKLNTKTGDSFNGAFGLGERVDEYFLREGTYSFWNRDHKNQEESGSAGDNNYGTHPFFAWQTPGDGT